MSILQAVQQHRASQERACRLFFRVAEQRKDKMTGKIIIDFINAPFQNFAKSSAGKTLCFPVTV